MRKYAVSQSLQPIVLPEAQGLKGGLFDVNKLPVVLVLERPVSQHTPATQDR